jgi:glycerophosphocholine phosphodiesterase GPCPD1
MQRWFFLEDNKKGKSRPPKKMALKEPEPANEITEQQWIFTVSAADVKPKEKVFITGSIQELGEWDFNKIVPMEYEPRADVWTKTITIPNTCEISYRYVISLVSDDNKDLFICRWETSIHPRIINENMLHPTVDIFGECDGKQKVGSGWLTSQTLVQFKFINNPLKLKSRLSERLMNIKVTPVKLSFGTEPHIEESSVSTDTMDVEMPEGVLVEVSSLDNCPLLCKPRPQEQFGREYRPDDVLLLNVFAPNPSGLAYLVDFYSYSSRASSEDPPCNIGYTYVLPNMFKASEGSIELPVTCNVKHRPLGTVKFEYLIVKPMEEKLCNLQVSYGKHWDPSWTGLEVGHRGLGASFKTKE